MTPERWAQIEKIFHRAAECDPEKRATLLDESCRGDLELREEVESLLSRASGSGNLVRAAVCSSLDDFGFSLIGEVVSHYRILAGLGGGGMGLVYRAEDLKLGRQVAIKFLPEESAKDPLALARFEREARAASALEHPNICPIYEFGEHQGQLFLVMQLLEGQTLRELLKGRTNDDQRSHSASFGAASRQESALSLKEVVELSEQIAAGLEAAHRKGIIHRDIKPANIFVTNGGQAKILDFGLAKLARTETDPDVNFPESSYGIGAKGPSPTPNPYLSRTGVAMGTAGYMSPEQARGEKLDARTDLFSFGLVLYEMATGHRAFPGDTGPVLHEAILNCKPTPARQSNPEVPARLEQVITKALEKNRETRYQTVAELRADLEFLKHEMAPRNLARRRMLASASVMALLIAGTIFWFARRQSTPSQTLPDLKLRQLTVNSSENPVKSGAISPDGKYLAYTEGKGMHIKLIGSDEAQSVPQPETLKNSNVNWEVVPTAWFPDSTKFLANAHPASERKSEWSSETGSIWIVSVEGGAPRKLRDHAIASSVSPDGLSISFGTSKDAFGEREIWLMGPNGEWARKLFEAGESGAICCLHFFPNGQRVSYISTDDLGRNLVARDLKGGPVTILLPPSEMQKLDNLMWLPDGRLTYSDACRPSQVVPDMPCNFWILRLGTEYGKRIEKPKRLTNWVGFWINGPSATADSKHIAFLESSAFGANLIADLEGGGTHLGNSRRFPLDDGGVDTIVGFTADSKAVIVAEGRGDYYWIRKQLLDSDTQETIVSSATGLIQVLLVSPDGKWVITQVRQLSADGSVQLMRVPITGGSPELIFPARDGTLSICARPPSNLCAIAEPTEDLRHAIVTAFDPVKGRGPELARFDLDSSWQQIGLPLFDISPDGKLFVTSPGAHGPIEIRSWGSQSVQVIRAEGVNNMRSLMWTGDGKGLLLTNSSEDGPAFMHVDLRGNTQVLWRCGNPQGCGGSPSPDGRLMAISDWKLSANMWMMENF